MTKGLPKPHDNMFAFPCPTQPNIAFEFAKWIFPTLSVDLSLEERLNEPLRRKLSLGKLSQGKLRTGSGYCLGVVVETSMSVANQADTAGNKTRTDEGLKDILSDW
jgi:hypothetical protein